MCSCQPAFGHFVPLQVMAAALQQAGHQVTFVTASDFTPRIEEAGFATSPAGDDMTAAGYRVISSHPEFFGLTPLEKRIFAFQHVFGGEVLDAKFESVHDTAIELRPDVILHDPGELAGPLAAELLGCPNVCVGYGLMLQAALRDAAAAGARQCWERHGLPAPPDGGLFRHLYLDRWPLLLADPAVPAVPNARPIRPSMPTLADGYGEPEGLRRLGRRPLVYVTQGTVYNQDLRALQVVLDGLSRLAVDIVATVGPGGDPASLSWNPVTTVVAPYIPHAALLPRCALVVTHGGSGSILEPLGLGIPLVVVPQGADHFENAAAVERAGAGITMLPDDLNPERVATAAERLLNETTTRSAAAAVAAEIAAMPSPADLVPTVEHLIER
jgi:UDP:flavonoid glycosyltransferase YjiC (YdhE family)